MENLQIYIQRIKTDRLFSDFRTIWIRRKIQLIIASCTLLFLSITYLYHSKQYPISINSVDSSKSINLPLGHSIVDVVGTSRGEPTILKGGIPGFYVFENLWYNKGTFYAFTSTENNDDIPEKDKIMSGPHDVVRHAYEDQKEIMEKHGAEVIYFDDKTIFLNDGADKWNWSYLNWFYHLAAEALLGGITSLAVTYDHLETIPDNKIARLLIPWEGNWRDNYGINEAMIKGIFNNDVIEKDLWSELSDSNRWIGFEKVVIVDRYASHRHNTISNVWNKMSLPIFEELSKPPPPFFSPYRESLLSNLDLLSILKPTRYHLGKPLKSIPKIVYLDRQESTRKLSVEDNQGLLDVFENLTKHGKAIYENPHLPELSFKQQVEVVKDADIIIGIHGNGLTHQLWMPEGGIVIELFVPKAFLRDYQVLSQALGHRHITIWDDRELPPNEWELIKGQLNPTIMHNGTLIPLQTEFIRTLLEDLVGEMSS